jgi:putative transposase
MTMVSMTLSERWGRLFISVSYAIRTPAPRPPAKPDVCAGVDLGLRTLATVAATDGELHEFTNPVPLRTTLAERRRAGRQLSRRIPGSRGHEQAKTKLARLDRRAVHLRREAWHQLTHTLVSAYGEVVIEDLDIAAMKRSMGRRAFRRAVCDAALGQFRPMLGYKRARTGTTVTIAERWYPSSQIHHGCGCRLYAPARLARQLACQVTGELVDRDTNAAKNLRDWPDHASSGPVGATAPAVSRSTTGGGDAGSGTGGTRRRRSGRKTSAFAEAVRGEARTGPGPRPGQEP